MIRDLLVSTDEPQVMPYGRYETFSYMVSVREDVKTRKFLDGSNVT